MFANRKTAGQALAARLADLVRNDPAFQSDPVVIALPRGGVPIAVEVARVLDAPMDLAMVRKIGVPWHPELAAAAIVDGANPVIVRNEDIIEATGLSAEKIEDLANTQLAEIARRRKLYLADRPATPVSGKCVIIVDDGIATGATATAAIRAIRQQDPAAIIFAVPVAPSEAHDTVAREVDRFVVLETPSPFMAVGAHYRDFGEVTDADVSRLLSEAQAQD